MKINYTSELDQLPTIIANCTSPVYALFGSDNRVVLNENPEMFRFFKGTCETLKGNIELDLQFTDPKDASNVLNYLVGGARAKTLKSA